MWFPSQNPVCRLIIQPLGSYQTAWTMLRKLRSAMVRPARERLSETMEVDETYVGGIEQGKQGRGAERKFTVAIALELLDPKGFGRVRLRHVEDVSSASLIPFVRYAVEPGSEVHADGWSGYKRLSRQNYHHRPAACRLQAIRRTSSCRVSIR